MAENTKRFKITHNLELTYFDATSQLFANIEFRSRDCETIPMNHFPSVNHIQPIFGPTKQIDSQIIHHFTINSGHFTVYDRVAIIISYSSPYTPCISTSPVYQCMAIRSSLPSAQPQ